jgi:hypothetical protein
VSPIVYEIELNSDPSYHDVMHACYMRPFRRREDTQRIDIRYSPEADLDFDDVEPLQLLVDQPDDPLHVDPSTSSMVPQQGSVAPTTPAVGVFSKIRGGIQKLFRQKHRPATPRPLPAEDTREDPTDIHVEPDETYEDTKGNFSDHEEEFRTPAGSPEKASYRTPARSGRRLQMDSPFSPASSDGRSQQREVPAVATESSPSDRPDSPAQHPAHRVIIKPHYKRRGVQGQDSAESATVQRPSRKAAESSKRATAGLFRPTGRPV